jgi:hypothetical protein
MTRTKHPVQISLQPLGILSLEMFATVRTDIHTILGTEHTLGRPRCRWEIKIKIDLKEIWREGKTVFIA